MRSVILPFFTACFTAAASLSQAHEFWISPEAYTVAPDEEVQAEIRVGETFKGGGYPYIPNNFKRFDLVQGDREIAVEGVVGDRPALSQVPPSEGLWVIVHQTRDYSLTYREWEKFQNFAEHKDFGWAFAEHTARGLSTEEPFKERYSRYGKSLIAVGDGAGADRRVGLLTEIVALANPYTDDVAEGLPVQVYYDGAPRADEQVEVFARPPEGEVKVTTYRTDGDGIAVISVQPGYEYLIDSVVLRAVEPAAEGDPVWESLWASLTLEIPQ